jgi:small subunit ribosomal protein S16
MLKIRLQRVGRKHEPSFRLVLTDSKNSTKSGKFKEILGAYDPRKTTDLLKADRIKYWLSTGAQLSDTVHNLLVNHKIIDAKKKNVLPKKTAPVKAEEPVVESAPVVEEAVIEETPVAEEVAAEENTVEEVAVEEAPAVEEAAPVEETPSTEETQ